jgi:WD40 repeat protein
MQNPVEVKVLTGHQDFIKALAFSPDGKLLAITSTILDKAVLLWNVENPEEVKVLTGHENYISALAFSPDGKLLATGSWDQTVRLWNVENPEEVKVLTGHENYIWALAFSPDSKWLAIGYLHNIVRLWNMENPEQAKVLTGHEGTINVLAFNPDGKWLATGSDDTIRLWSFQQIYELAKNLNYPKLMLLLKLSQMEANLVLGNDYFHRLYHSITDPKLKKAINLYFPTLCSSSAWRCSIIRSSSRTKIIAITALAAAGIGASAYYWLKNNKSSSGD